MAATGLAGVWEQLGRSDVLESLNEIYANVRLCLAGRLRVRLFVNGVSLRGAWIVVRLCGSKPRGSTFSALPAGTAPSLSIRILAKELMNFLDLPSTFPPPLLSHNHTLNIFLSTDHSPCLDDNHTAGP